MRKVGNVFTSDVTKSSYLVAQVDSNRVALICLANGNRWEEPVEVEDAQNISASEFHEMADGLSFDAQYDNVYEYLDKVYVCRSCKS